MSTHKLDLEKFNGSNDLASWKVKMKALLVQQGCAAALEREAKLPKDMASEKKVDIIRSEHRAVLCGYWPKPHLTYNRNWFDSFKEWDGRVKMGNDWVRNIKDSGTVQIKMHDGMVRKLDYWYVPKLRKNLMSLGTLDKNGMRCAGEDDWVKVTKGSLL